MILDLVSVIGLAFFYMLFTAVYASPIFFFFIFVVFKNVKNFKLALTLSVVFTLVIFAAVLYLTKDAPRADDAPPRYGQYRGLIGF